MDTTLIRPGIKVLFGHFKNFEFGEIEDVTNLAHGIYFTIKWEDQSHTSESFDFDKSRLSSPLKFL